MVATGYGAVEIKYSEFFGGVGSTRTIAGFSELEEVVPRAEKYSPKVLPFHCHKEPYSVLNECLQRF